jgi:hypothetical protein
MLNKCPNGQYTQMGHYASLFELCYPYVNSFQRLTSALPIWDLIANSKDACLHRLLQWLYS